MEVIACEVISASSLSLTGGTPATGSLARRPATGKIIAKDTQMVKVGSCPKSAEGIRKKFLESRRVVYNLGVSRMPLLAGESAKPRRGDQHLEQGRRREFRSGKL